MPPTVIDIFKDTHCSSKSGFNENAKDAIVSTFPYLVTMNNTTDYYISPYGHQIIPIYILDTIIEGFIPIISFLPLGCIFIWTSLHIYCSGYTYITSIENLIFFLVLLLLGSNGGLCCSTNRRRQRSKDSC